MNIITLLEKRTLLAVSILFAFSTVFAQPKFNDDAAPKLNQTNTGIREDDRFAGLDTAFARVLAEWKAPGFAVAVVEGDKLVYAKGFGYKDWAAKKPVTANTVFAIGSCTKAFTASLIGLLESEGKLELDKPVRTYLPELHFYTKEMDDEVTLRDMMCHRTGLPRYDWSWSIAPSGSRDTLMRRIRYMEPTEPLRHKFQYNNAMYMIQGAVAEKLTGKSWEMNVQQKIFEPLGMSHSNFISPEWMQGDDAAASYDLKGDSLIHKARYRDIGAMAPAGGICSNVLDMAKWLTMWIHGGRYAGQKILPAEFVTAAISSQMVMDAGLPTTDLPDIQMANYGFGWALFSYRGHYCVEHNGNITGFSASVCFFPTDSIGVVVLCNQENSFVPGIVRNIIADRLLKTGYRDWQTFFYTKWNAETKKQMAAATIGSRNLKQGVSPIPPNIHYTGTYATAANETVNVWLKADSLFLATANDTFWCRPYNDNVFELLAKDDETGEIDTTALDVLKIVFGNDESGSISNLSCVLPDGNGKPVFFSKIKKPDADLVQPGKSKK